jgi:hypothetical protein
MPDEMTTQADALHHLLKERNTPEMRALNALGLNPRRYGLTDEPYSDAAFQEWEGVLRSDPANSQAAHHLAIMHHARAFDHEATYYFEDAERIDPDDDWKKALEYWFRLYEDDRFWEGLAKTVDSRVANPFPALRDALPERLLQVHFDVALDPLTPNYRARNHIRLALNSRFSQEVKDRLLAQAYQSYYSRISPGAWDPYNMDADLLEASSRPVIDFLRLYDNYLPALCDLLDLVSRIQVSVMQKLSIEENARAQTELVNRLVQLDATFGVYMARLDKRLDTLGSKPLGDLDLWHFYSGQAYEHSNQEDTALSHYQKGLAAAQQQGDEDAIERNHQAYLSLTGRMRYNRSYSGR